MRRPRGFSLIEIVVVVAILVVLAAVLFPAYLKGRRKTVPGPDGRPVPASRKDQSPMDAGRAPQCSNNLNQIRQAWTMATTVEDETRPASLADLRRYGVSETMRSCPVSRRPYQFDPATGTVRCAYHGN